MTTLKNESTAPAIAIPAIPAIEEPMICCPTFKRAISALEKRIARARRRYEALYIINRDVNPDELEAARLMYELLLVERAVVQMNVDIIEGREILRSVLGMLLDEFLVALSGFSRRPSPDDTTPESPPQEGAPS